MGVIDLFTYVCLHDITSPTTYLSHKLFKLEQDPTKPQKLFFFFYFSYAHFKNNAKNEVPSIQDVIQFLTGGNH